MDVTQRFAELLTRPEPQVRLDEASLLIAAHAYPDLDIEAEQAALDRLALGCSEPTLDGVVRHLFGELGFQGDESHYYDRRNSFLNEVTARRVGLPITLSVLTIEVGRRLGVPLAGVGMPGHFLVRDRVDPEVFVDPFRRGAVIDRAGCERAFRILHGPEAPFDPAYLEPVGAYSIVARLLANLKGVATREGDDRTLAWVLGLRCLIPGMPVSEQVEWAEALAAVGRFDRAADVLEQAASLAGGEPRWEARATGLRARLN